MALLSTRQSSLNFDERLKELDQFFQEKDPVHQALRRIVKRLEKAGISYAIMGGMAVFAHGHHRATNDVDLLLTEQGFEEFRQRFVPKKYKPQEGRSRRFIDPKDEVSIDILIAGRYPGSGKPGPVAFPDPADVREVIKKKWVVNLATLIQLKLAARRHQDFADVVSLIRVHNLDESFQDKLHPTLHRDYIECLEEKRREEEYEAREP